jgi:2,3-bisphosphoglycerate-independent phosphoglycerate mutase
MASSPKPTVLIILDGWGHRTDTDFNAIHHGSTPTWDSFLAERPHTLVETSGMAVGLPEGQMGNSEVGHMTLGSGRVVYQNFTRMTKAIDDGSFFDNPVYREALDKAIAADKAVHILGLMSPGGVHSHEDHINAMVKMAAERGARKVYVHAFLDGRDTPPQSAGPSLQNTDKLLKAAGIGRIASLCGRYYAMDRDQRWERIELAWKMLVDGEAPYHADDPMAGLEASYGREEFDEFVKPTLINGEGDARISDGDSVIFMNFRADRARQLSRAFVDADFNAFSQAHRPALASFVQSTEYAADINAPVAFPVENLTNSLGEYLAGMDKTQLRIAETEKYAHVTFFFSGGNEDLYQGEERALIPSPKVDTYDQQPEMSAPEVTERLCREITDGGFDLIVCNYANGDMVGHTGVYEAAVKAAEAIDQSLARVAEAVEKAGGQCLITADHGNCEMMLDENNLPHTQHTVGVVPLVYLGPRELSLASGGSLADIAPTLLDLMELPKPAEMSGQSLISSGSLDKTGTDSPA